MNELLGSTSITELPVGAVPEDTAHVIHDTHRILEIGKPVKRSTYHTAIPCRVQHLATGRIQEREYDTSERVHTYWVMTAEECWRGRFNMFLRNEMAYLPTKLYSGIASLRLRDGGIEVRTFNGAGYAPDTKTVQLAKDAPVFIRQWKSRSVHWEETGKSRVVFKAYLQRDEVTGTMFCHERDNGEWKAFYFPRIPSVGFNAEALEAFAGFIALVSRTANSFENTWRKIDQQSLPRAEMLTIK